MKFLYLLVSTPFLISCITEPHTDLNKFVIDSQAADYPANKETPNLSTINPLKFEMNYKKDPFMNNKESDLKLELPVNSSLYETNRKKAPLELYPLDELIMCGSLFLDGTMRGVVKNTNGELFIVKTGSYIGRDNGVVSNVISGEIEIVESFLNSKKRWDKIPTKLFLNPKPKLLSSEGTLSTINN